MIDINLYTVLKMLILFNLQIKKKAYLLIMFMCVYMYELMCILCVPVTKKARGHQIPGAVSCLKVGAKTGIWASARA